MCGLLNKADAFCFEVCECSVRSLYNSVYYNLRCYGTRYPEQLDIKDL